MLEIKPKDIHRNYNHCPSIFIYNWFTGYNNFVCDDVFPSELGGYEEYYKGLKLIDIPRIYIKLGNKTIDLSNNYLSANRHPEPNLSKLKMKLLWE